MELKKEKYRNVEITYEVNKLGKFVCCALRRKIFCSNAWAEYWDKIEDAERSIKDFIDCYLDNIPKTYKELAHEIEENLLWGSSEDCRIDEFSLKILVDNFMRYKSISSS